MEYKVIDRAHRADIQLKNEPFLLYGRMIPTYDGERWSCREKLFTAAHRRRTKRILFFTVNKRNPMGMRKTHSHGIFSVRKTPSFPSQSPFCHSEQDGCGR